MADEQIIYLSPEEELTNVRERLERAQARHIILVIPPQTQIRSHVGWRLLRSRARELGKDVLVISSDRQIRSVAKAAGFRVADSQESTSSAGTRPGSRPSRSGLGGRTPSRILNLPGKGTLERGSSTDIRMQRREQPDQPSQHRTEPIQEEMELSEPSHEKVSATPSTNTSEQTSIPMRSPKTDDRVGQQLGDYRLIRLLGQGPFSRVYLGEHIHLSNQVAVKMLWLSLASRRQEELFQKEMHLIARLRHPHIVQILDFGLMGEDLSPFLVMDYIPNGTLRLRHSKNMPLSLATIVDYVKQIAPALQYTHSQNVIHQSIKPENMLLGYNNNILLSDFGNAFMQGLADTHGVPENFYTYHTPEQLLGKPCPASDQYALGIVAYEWVCGDVPFHGVNDQVLLQHMQTPPPSLREKVPTIPTDVEEVVMKALSKDPKQRFPSVQEFANALERAYLSTIAIRVFYCYAHEDKTLRDQLEKHLNNLKRQNQITSWYDREISAGKEWEREIDRNLNEAHIILLLISPDFMGSEYCYSIEMKHALERHDKGEAHVVPIILRPVDWEDAPFSKLQVLPTDGKPVDSSRWYNHDEAFEDVAKGIRKVIKEFRKSRLSTS